MIGRRIVIIILVVLALWGGASAQRGGTPLVALVNNSGQLVVASGDGAYRWIITNPGEQLAPDVGYRWSPNGDMLFWGIQQGAQVRFFMGDIASMTPREVAVVDGLASGGEWVDSSTVVIAVDNNLLALSANGNTRTLAASNSPISLRATLFDSPYTPMPKSYGYNNVFYASGGSYFLYSMAQGQITALPGTNEAQARNSGLWADSAPLLAYWGFDDDGTSNLYVVGVESGTILNFDSGRSAPIFPLAWRANSTELIYRDGSNVLRLADVGCAVRGCSDNPLANGVAFMPATASEIQVTADYAFFREDTVIYAVPFNCVASDSCLNSAVAVVTDAAAQTPYHVANGRLVYTAFRDDARNPNDRSVHMVDLACLNSGACAAMTLLPDAVAGLLSSDGAYVVVDIIGQGMQTLNVDTLTLTYLSGAGGQPGDSLSFARWQ
ncbi:MAG: hypothetical protein D6712_04780 [Chloroflexi bacterium]|nr:MAG: hypothetical protein D6712_04780 [Chloroflexota bacterium]